MKGDELALYHIYDGEKVTCRTLCEKHGGEQFRTTDMVYVSMCQSEHHELLDYCEDCDAAN